MDSLNRYTVFFMLPALLVASAASQDRNTEMNTGRMVLQFTETHPLSHPKSIIPRHGWDKMTESGTFITTRPYKISDETYSVYIPESYDDSQPFGLFIWVSAWHKGGPPDIYLPVLDRLRLIWIGCNNIGNKRHIPDRIALTLDGLHNILKRYHIDRERIYVSGFSGGGRIASNLAIIYPELFAGGYYMIGCDYREDVVSNDGGIGWPGFWPFSDPKIVEMGHSNRFTLLTGSRDFNKVNTELVWEAYRQEGKKWIAYVEVPKMDHRLPDARWFELGLQALERPRRLMNNIANVFPRFPDQSAVSLSWIEEQLILVENLREQSPLHAAFILDGVCQLSKGFAEKKEVEMLLESMTDDRSLKEALKVRKKIYRWHLELLEKGYDKKWVKTMLHLEKSIYSVLDKNPPEPLQQELQWMLEIL